MWHLLFCSFMMKWVSGATTWMIWCFLKKNEYAVQLSNSKKNPSQYLTKSVTPSERMAYPQNLQLRCFHKCKYKGFIKRCKPLVTEQNVAKVRNATWHKGYCIICQTWWGQCCVMGVYSCHSKWIISLLMWLLTKVARGYTLSLRSAKRCKTNQKELYSANG